MPIPTPPVHDGGISVDNLVKVIVALIGALVSLVVWAWRKMEKGNDKLELFLTLHTQNDEKIHDTLFTQQRESDAKINKLIGEVEVISGKRK